MYFYGFRFRPLGIGLHGLPIVADPGQQLTSLEAMRQRHPHLQHVLSASCVRWRPALLPHRSTGTLSLLLHFGASQLHRATSVPLVDFIEHPINRSRCVSCCSWGTRSRFPCLRRALFSACQAWGLKDIDYERFLRETVVNLNCAASASGWLLPLDFGVVPCSKCHSRDFIGQYRKRPVYHLNRSLGGRRLVRLPGMAASNVCERVLSTHIGRTAPVKAAAQHYCCNSA